jgi:glycerophosphoryl diester phosphodiesterase
MRLSCVFYFDISVLMMRLTFQIFYIILCLNVIRSTAYGMSGPVGEVDLQITAHRGNSSQYPENTIPAFQSAISLQLDWAELDVHMTKDGRLVVTHDASTGRVGERDLTIAQRTYDELKTVDVAHKFRETYQLTLAQCPRQTIPLLEEVLLLFKNSDRTKISIQPKVDCVKPAIALINKMGMAGKVGFNDGNLNYMKAVKKLAPAIWVFWDRPHNSDIDEDIRVAKSNKFESLVINEKGITPEKIQKVKAAGIEVGAWTVNEIETMKRFIGLGVQRIYTDEPQKLALIRSDQETVFCEGIYKQHLQGICVDSEGNIFWSWTGVLVKTDPRGRLLAKAIAPSHQGDLCVKDGNLYVAVNLGKFNQPDNKADSWVFQYDANDLREIRRIPVPELIYGAGGMVSHQDKFFIVGGLPVGSADNTVYEYDQNFKFQKRHLLKSGYTKMGIQTIAQGNGNWWLGCYGEIPVTLQLNESFNLVGKHQIDMSLGVDVLKNGLLIVGNNFKSPMRGHTGYVQKRSVSSN